MFFIRRSGGDLCVAAFVEEMTFPLSEVGKNFFSHPFGFPKGIFGKLFQMGFLPALELSGISALMFLTGSWLRKILGRNKG
jgi:hypothetical protein